jgi:hypothetical protein
MTIAKECEGCQSNKIYRGIKYYQCKVNLGSTQKLHRIFREQYCPCTTCLVKSICTEPKLNIFKLYLSINISEEDNYDHKCTLFVNQVRLFRRNILNFKDVI